MIKKRLSDKKITTCFLLIEMMKLKEKEISFLYPFQFRRNSISASRQNSFVANFHLTDLELEILILYSYYCLRLIKFGLIRCIALIHPEWRHNPNPKYQFMKYVCFKIV
jgi:hypothetical protein